MCPVAGYCNLDPAALPQEVDMQTAKVLSGEAPFRPCSAVCGSRPCARVLADKAGSCGTCRQVHWCEEVGEEEEEERRSVENLARRALLAVAWRIAIAAMVASMVGALACDRGGASSL